jgi:hypothetical protein
VFLHGPAASGKLTVARAVAERLAYPVFHNHLTVDLLTTVFPFGSDPFVRLRSSFWLAVISEAARAGRSLLFTFAPESTVPFGFPGQVRQAVESEGGRTHFVRLTVGAAEQERRLTSQDRREFHKLVDVDVLRAIRNRRDVVEQPPVDLSIDTDVTRPPHAADLIVTHFGLVPQQPASRYPSAEENDPPARR